MDARVWTRRELLVRGGGLAAAAAVGLGIGSRAPRAWAQVGGDGVIVAVPDYPFFPGTLMEEDADLATQIPPLQEAAIARGRMVWDGLLDVQGFSQEAYEQLLDISSAFLETVQATALAAVEAVVEKDVVVGRQAATANACMAVWLGSYITGLTDGREGRALPEFESL